MTGVRRAAARVVALADGFLPAGSADVELVRRVRVAVAQSALGIVSTLLMSAAYAAMGSPISAGAIGAVALGLLAVPSAIRRGVPVERVGDAMMALAFASSLAVALRTGGFGSPAVVWTFLLPLSVYAVSGRRSAVAWTVLATFQVAGLYAANRFGVPFADDLDPRDLDVMRVLGYVGVLGASLALLLVLDGARVASLEVQRAAERALDRQRILDDMHDGVGSQLLGLLLQARSGTLAEGELVAGLESSLDDLRLIVDSLDPVNESLEAALHALRVRLRARFEAAGVQLSFDVDEAVAGSFESAASMQILRALQEMLTNTLRHARAQRVQVRLGRLAREGNGPERVELAVQDDGIGLGGEPLRRGRGMKSLTTRALKLGGRLVVEPRAPGLRVAIEMPIPHAPPIHGMVRPPISTFHGRRRGGPRETADPKGSP